MAGRAPPPRRPAALRPRPGRGGGRIDLAATRAELPVLERLAYLNTGTFGPLPRRSAEAMARWQRRALESGRSGLAYWEEVRELRGTLRAALARQIRADERCVALTTSTTEGCNIVVAGLRLGPDDEVVTTDVEHPGLVSGLRAWNVRLHVAHLRERPAAEALAAIDAVITPRTRLVALSHVAWTTGAVIPVEEVAGRGVPVLVDGAQAAGAIPVDVESLGCDFYTVSGQKWLLGPDATGCLYVRRDRIGELQPSFPSYLSWEDPVAFEPWPDARRFESTWVPPPSVGGLLAAIDFAEEVGESRFQAARAGAERCRELVAARGDLVTEAEQATLVSWNAGPDAADVVRRLEEGGVIVRDFPGLGWVRASCGFWTSEDDLERLAGGL